MLDEKEIAQRFGEGFDCSMVVLSEVSDLLELTKDQTNRLASCFGIGMMQGSICGAISAGFLAIGYKYGNTKPNDTAQKGLVMAKKEEFLNKFKETYGEKYTCPMLLDGLDLRRPEDMKKAQDQNILSEFCPKVCRTAITIIRDII